MEHILVDDKKLPQERYYEAVSEDLKGFLGSDLVCPSLTNIKEVFKDRELPMIMFSFDDLLDEIKNDFPAAEHWSADWLEELFEDSFSVMSFNLEFLYLFDSVLDRYKGGDQRHPPQHLRLAVALSVKLLSFRTELEEHKTLPDVSDWPAYKEAMGLISEEEYKSLSKFYSDELKTDREVVWLVAKKIWDLYKWMKIPSNEESPAKKAITKAMADYRSTKPGKEWYPDCEGIAEVAFPFLGILKVDPLNETDQLELKKNKYQVFLRAISASKIDDFLKTKSILKSRLLGYRELLALSFYGVDFNVGLNPTYTFRHAKTSVFNN